MTTKPTDLQQDDLLWRHLKTVPAFRALLRAVEARFYQATELPEPILDLGCGDGHFAQMVFDKPLTVGIDPWWGPLNKAAKTGMYQTVLQGMGDKLPFPDNTFNSAISNSVLEHIPDIQPVLNEIGRVLKPDGRFLITMPCHRFTQQLGGAAFFESIGLPGMADRYRRFFNFIARHVHTDSAEVWAKRLAEAGLAVERWQYYFSTGALRALEWGHVQGLPSAVMHALTGQWIVAPWKSSLARTEQWVRPYYEAEPNAEDGTYVVFIARKVADGPIEPYLPPARPFTVEELQAADQPAAPTTPKQENVPPKRRQPAAATTTAAETAVTPPVSPPAPAKTGINRQTITAILGLFTLLVMMIGQATVRGRALADGTGTGWFLAGFALLFVLAWWQNPRRERTTWQWPSLSAIPAKRWWVIVAAFLAMMAQRWGSTGQDWLAIAGWLGGGVLAGYALWEPDETLPENGRSTSRFHLIAAVTLFFTALFLRTFNLSSHPFILNGIEASLGLNAVQTLHNQLNNPFATGWLTNPTLPAYLQALAIAIFGQTTFALRIVSAVLGALTVTAVFYLGKRLFGQTVGLLAAILLTGMHLHLHYSRLGMTNVWDGLLILLALGSMAAAWERPSRQQWLAAGAFTGLCAYVYTASHLLPIMLAGTAVTILLADRAALREQWRHWLAAILLAAIIALPQLLFYRQNPGIYMERANALGILDGQTGWLNQEAALRNIPASDLLAQQLWAGLLAFNSGQDQSPAYRPETTLLSYWMGLFFVLGAGIALTRWRRMSYRLLLVWVLTTLVFGAALLLQPPNSHRIVSAAPAVALLAAVGLAAAGEWLAGLVPGWRQGAQWMVLVLAVAAGLLALGDVGFYYGRYRQTHQFADRNTEVADQMAHYLNTLQGEWTAYFYGAPAMFVDFPTILYLAPDFQRNVNLFDVIDVQAPPPAAEGTAVYIVLPENAQALTMLEERYPNGTLQTFDGYYGAPLFWAYEVRP